MKSSSMTVSLRQGVGKGVARKLRAAGKVPGVVYGEGETGRPIQIEQHGFDALIRSGGHHGILDVEFEAGHEPLKALVREIQIHPVSRRVVHVDLQKINMNKPIRLNVAITLEGKPEGVRNQGGILEHNLREVEIECLPNAIPDELTVDVNHLEVGQALHISDLGAEGITVLGHPDTTIATVSLPAAERSVEEEAEAEAAAEGEAAEGEAATEGDEGQKEQAEGEPGSS